MKGNAPKSPETGSHAVWKKNFRPKAWREGLERRIRITKMKRTMTKMLRAQMSINAAKVLSAS